MGLVTLRNRVKTSTEQLSCSAVDHAITSAFKHALIFAPR